MSKINRREEQESQIEISIEEAKIIVERKNMMDRLIQNPDFDKLFTEGYMQNESARLVSLLADTEWQDKSRQESLVNDMRAISGMRQYIMAIRTLGRQMEARIASSEETLEELRNEEE